MASAMKQTDARSTERDLGEAPPLDWRNRSRRYFTVEQKRAIVGECLKPGASLSSIALKHGLNANMVRKWVVREAAGTLEVSRGRKPSMIPAVVTNQTDACDDGDGTSRCEMHTEIETPRGVMRISGEFDPLGEFGPVEALVFGAVITVSSWPTADADAHPGADTADKAHPAVQMLPRPPIAAGLSATKRHCGHIHAPCPGCGGRRGSARPRLEQRRGVTTCRADAR